MLVGDPESRFHPVRFLGFLAKTGETILYPLPIPKLTSGILLLLLVLAVSLGMGMAGLSIAPVVWSIFMFWAGIAFRSLLNAGSVIAKELSAHNLEGARKKLSLIVSRDTNNLSQHDVIRGTIESLSENLNDGVIAPLFYAFLFGVPGIIAYKTINTLDSMVGYKNPRYINFGWASARLDDVANFIPARLTFLLVFIASLLLGFDARSCARVTYKQSQTGPSPNGGIGICAFAGALGVQLGGRNYSEGKPVDTPLVGIAHHTLSIGTISDAQTLIMVSTLLGLALGVILI